MGYPEHQFPVTFLTSKNPLDNFVSLDLINHKQYAETRQPRSCLTLTQLKPWTYTSIVVFHTLRLSDSCQIKSRIQYTWHQITENSSSPGFQENWCLPNTTSTPYLHFPQIFFPSQTTIKYNATYLSFVPCSYTNISIFRNLSTFYPFSGSRNLLKHFCILFIFQKSNTNIMHVAIFQCKHFYFGKSFSPHTFTTCNTYFHSTQDIIPFSEMCYTTRISCHIQISHLKYFMLHIYLSCHNSHGISVALLWNISSFTKTSVHSKIMSHNILCTLLHHVHLFYFTYLRRNHFNT